MKNCATCDRPKPALWCWNNLTTGCPMGMQPRNLDIVTLWRRINELETRLTHVEAMYTSAYTPVWVETDGPTC